MLDHYPTEVIGSVPRSAATEGTTAPGGLVKGRRKTRVPQQKLELATLPHVQDIPQLAREDDATDSCHAATKHVIPRVPQQLQSAAEISDTHKAKASTRSAGMDIQRKIIPKFNSNAPLAKKIRDRTQHNNGSTGDKVFTVQSEEVQSETKFRRLTLSLPRKPETWGKRSARKKYTLHLKTEVDWNEDLRPTDDEDLCHANSNDEGTSVSTPDPEPMCENEQKESRKRKGSNAQTSSGKRKKPAKCMANNKRESSRQPQLHLTSLIAEPTMELQPEAIASNTKTDLLPGGQSEDFSAAGKPHKNSLSEPATQQHEIIEITSSPMVSESTSSDYGIDVLRGQTYRVIGTSCDGRGKSVGQKLADALHGVQLHSQLRPAVETTLHTTYKGHIGSDRQEAASPSSRLPTIDGSQGQYPHLLDHGIEQTQASFGTREQRQGLAGAFQLTHTTKLPSEIANLHNAEETQTFAKPRGSLNDRDSVNIRVGSDGINDHSPTQYYLPQDHAQVSLETVDAIKDPRRGVVQSPRAVSEHDTDSSSQSPPEIGTRTLPAMLFRSRNNKAHHTPESQKSLLRLQTPIHARVSILGGFRTAPKSSIVDSKGSPRLMLQVSLAADKAQSPLKDVQARSDVEIPDTSSSNYDKGSDGYSLDSGEDEVTWSKYQRDMFMEYGFQTASMKKSRAQSPPPKRDSEIDKSNKVIVQQVTKDLPVDPISAFLNPPLGASTRQCHAHGVNQDRTAEVAPGPNQISTAELSAYADQDPIAPLSTKMLRPSQSAPEAQQFSQSGESNFLDWISTLQAAQKSAHDLLLETNKRLSSQLAAEQETIRQVLHIYRQGCNRILDDLFQAQQVRMGLYQQQMTVVKEQHHQICRELVLGLQDLDHRVQGE
ncbi:hypothetical protein N7507_010655 [Penicillium longicatenatum]|nr:hypothetical protein N7507_010655 [Penicillium longicatenatum]